MATKKQSKEISVSPDVLTGAEFGAKEGALALFLGLNLQASADVRTEQAVFAYNLATRHLVEAGVLLSSVKAEMSQDEFLTLIEGRGLGKRRAYELMQGAAFAASLPTGQLEQVLSLSKSKVLALASADPAVVQAMLEDGDIDVDLMGVRELRHKIRDLEAAVADRDVQIETVEAEAKAAKKAASRQKDRASEVPIVVFDIRAEAVAQVENARLCVDEFNALARDLVGLVGVEGVYDWVDPTARLIVSGMLALRLQLDGVVQYYLKGFDLTDVVEEPMSYLDPEEVLAAAKKYADLVATHQHEKALRDWERQQERPRGKGRPTAKPEAPKLNSGE